VSFLLLLWVCASGALLARRWDEESKRVLDTFALGAALGLAIFAAFGFVLGWAFGLTPATVITSALATSAVGLGLGARPSALGLAARAARPGAGMVVVIVLTSLFVGRLADRALFVTPEGIATGDRHNFGDLPFHMGIAAGFAYGNNFPPEHPELAGVPLTYPFFGDLVSGMILAVGGSWKDAFFWPGLILGLSVVVALTRFGEAMTGSRALGRLTALLTFFSGGLGFLGLTDPPSVAKWWTEGPDLTINDGSLRYANFITTLFIPQRSILFGWPLLFFALSLIVEGVGKDRADPKRTRLWLRAGILGSLLPLVHTHSFAVLGFCVLAISGRAGLGSLAACMRGMAPLATPAVLFMATRNSLVTRSFLAWQPGFDGGAAHPLEYWLTNAGLFLPLVLAGLLTARGPSARFVIAAPFIALFTLANLFRLSPWIWDNMKFLAPAHAGLAPLAALFLGRLWRRGAPGKIAALSAVIVTTLSGALDASKVAAAGGRFDIFQNADLAFAQNVRAATAPDDTILTAPVHNHPILLTGRREFLGYEGHLWSQGLNSTSRKSVAEAMFRGEAQPLEPGVVRVKAIALTPAERNVIKDPTALGALPGIVDSPYRLLRVR
jgi:hypothetical protein